MEIILQSLYSTYIYYSRKAVEVFVEKRRLITYKLRSTLTVKRLLITYITITERPKQGNMIGEIENIKRSRENNLIESMK